MTKKSEGKARGSFRSLYNEVYSGQDPMNDFWEVRNNLTMRFAFYDHYYRSVNAKRNVPMKCGL